MGDDLASGLKNFLVAFVVYWYFEARIWLIVTSALIVGEGESN